MEIFNGYAVLSRSRGAAVGAPEPSGRECQRRRRTWLSVHQMTNATVVLIRGLQCSYNTYTHVTRSSEVGGVTPGVVEASEASKATCINYFER